MPVLKADELVLAYRSPSSVEARSLALILEDAGVAVRVVGDFLEGAYPGLAMGGMANKEVWIASSDLAVAAPLVHEWRQTHHPGGDPEDAGPVKPQFSLRTALIVLTFATLLLALAQLGPEAVSLAVVLSLLLLLLTALAIALPRWRRGPKSLPSDAAASDSAGRDP